MDGPKKEKHLANSYTVVCRPKDVNILEQYVLEKTHKKDCNFTRKFTSSQINLKSIPLICAACLFNGCFQNVTGLKQS